MTAADVGEPDPLLEERPSLGGLERRRGEAARPQDRGRLRRQGERDERESRPGGEHPPPTPGTEAPEALEDGHRTR